MKMMWEFFNIDAAPPNTVLSCRVLSPIVLHFLNSQTSSRKHRTFDPHMLLSKDYVGYLAREVTKKLIAAKAIETSSVAKVTERVHAALLDELTLEDRINDEVRVILEAYSEEMNKTGANYQEMFRKVKTELVRKYKAVL
jgi:hypothetical protein